jgi:hypothetical protein
MFKSHKIKSIHRVLRINKVDTYGATVFAPDYSTTVLATKLALDSMSVLCQLDFYAGNPLIVSVSKVSWRHDNQHNDNPHKDIEIRHSA